MGEHRKRNNQVAPGQPLARPPVAGEASWLANPAELAFYATHSAIAVLTGPDEGLGLLQVNPAFERLSGLCADDLLGRPFWSFLASAPDPTVGEALVADLLAHGWATTRLQGTRRDGSALCFELHLAPVHAPDGQLARCVATLTDVGADQAAEAALASALQENESIMQAIPDVLYLLDPEGRLVKWNAELERVTGLAAADLFGRSVLSFFHEADQPAIEASILRKLTEGRSVVETNFPTPADSEAIYRWSGASVHDIAGRLIGIVGTGRDVTERRRMEREIRRQNDALRQLDALKRDFINAIAHELRTPLTTIMGYLEFLEDGLGGPMNAAQAGFVEQIRDGARRLLRLVEDMLDIARFEAGTFRLEALASDLARTVSRAVASLLPLAQARRIALACQTWEQAIVWMDPMRIEQVVTNLVSNALKFSPEGGRVEVCLAAGANVWRVEVRDAGPGISPEHQTHLFERFYQVTPGGRKTGGLGLGLFIARALVEAHGGTIGVKSAPGEGTTFWFELPGGAACRPETPPGPPAIPDGLPAERDEAAADAP